MLLGDVICERLRGEYTLSEEDFVAPRLRRVPLFEFIVATVLSQNTSDKNAWRAYSNLKARLGEIRPERVLGLSAEELAELIRPAGMYYARSKRIVELARVFLEKSVEKTLEEAILSGGVEEARRILLELPGVGFKTADVVLLMYFNKPAFPVDTHITRITLRLGFVKKRDYEEMRLFWMRNTSPDKYLELHLLLIEHGRETCRARKPSCEACVLLDMCEYARSRQ